MPTRAESTNLIVNAVASQYENDLVIPDHKPKNQFILCPVGLVGAGKTTVLKPLSEKLSLVIISGDEIRKLLYDRGLSFNDTWKIRQSLIKKLVLEGYGVAHDSDCDTHETQQFLKVLAMNTGIRLIWIHINPPEKFIINKLMSYDYSRSWLFQDSKHAIQNYYQRKPLHKNLNLPFLYTFDTSKENLPQQIDEAIKVIGTEVGF